MLWGPASPTWSIARLPLVKGTLPLLAAGQVSNQHVDLVTRKILQVGVYLNRENPLALAGLLMVVVSFLPGQTELLLFLSYTPKMVEMLHTPCEAK